MISISYVSLEYVLAKYGFLAESVFAITSITLKTTREYDSEIGDFYYKNIKETLFSGYEYEIENKHERIFVRTG